MDTGIKYIDDGGQAYWPEHHIHYSLIEGEGARCRRRRASWVGKEPKEVIHGAATTTAEEEAGVEMWFEESDFFMSLEFSFTDLWRESYYSIIYRLSIYLELSNYYNMEMSFLTVPPAGKFL